MSRGKLRSTVEVCADCGAPDPTWASINRGILICDECCSIHRSLGRHVSQVKSLKKGLWSPTQLAMVHTLYNNGANSIWEHSLLDPSNAKSGRKKPNPKDPVHPTKADFIRAKHQVLAFVYRPGKEDNHFAEGDVSKQLHSSVRTANLETSLRLLSLGADPNYFHTEKGNCPIHVAAKAGQSSQVELLVVYGADPGAFDSDGKSPVDYARLNGHNDLADHLIELQYELTDRVGYYLCGRKPDHHCGQHFIIPEMADSLDMSELAKAAKKKLQALPNHLFEELGMDIYDEVDRRETDAIWLSTQNQSALVTDRCSVPFLPVNPEFSSTRNQGRQKLARFNAREFATLIIDFLSDAKRRQMGLSVTAHMQREKGNNSSPNKQQVVFRCSRKSDAVSDDEPLYDSVASDEDSILDQQLASIDGMQDPLLQSSPSQKLVEKHPDVIPEESIIAAGKCNANISMTSTSSTSIPSGTSSVNSNCSKDDKTVGDFAKKITLSSAENIISADLVDRPFTMEDYFNMKKQLITSQGQIQQLLQNNNNMKQEINMLQNMLQKLINENASLRSHIQVAIDSGAFLPNGHDGQILQSSSIGSEARSPRGSPRSSQRPQSMYEPREQLRQQHTPWSSSTSKREDTLKVPSNWKSSGDEVDNPVSIYNKSSIAMANSIADLEVDKSSVLQLPAQQEVVKKTEQITKKIQELLISAQEGKHDSFIPCSEKIHGAVADMASIFPQNVKEEAVAVALRQLTTSALRLQTECRTLLAPAQDTPIDYRFVTQQVIQCAYDIAKAAKQLVTLFQ